LVARGGIEPPTHGFSVLVQATVIIIELMNWRTFISDFQSFKERALLDYFKSEYKEDWEYEFGQYINHKREKSRLWKIWTRSISKWFGKLLKGRR